MIRNGIALLAVALLGMVATPTVRAGFITTNVTFNVQGISSDDLLLHKPIAHVLQIDTSNGTAYSNTIGTGPGGTARVGDTFHTITAQQVLGATDLSGDTFSSVQWGNTTNIFALTSLEGTISGGTPTTGFTVNFFAAVLTLYTQTAGGFKVNDPSTWAGKVTPVARLVLGPKESVQTGPVGAPVTYIPGSLMNQSNPNAVHPIDQNQSDFLFVKHLPDPYAGVSLGGLPLGNSTLNTYADTDGIPADEGIYIQASENLQGLSNFALGWVSSGGAVTAKGSSSLTNLNGVYSAALGTSWATGIATTAVASGSDFNAYPFGTAAGPVDGDFTATIQTKIYPVGVPEPSTAMLVLGVGLAAVFARRHRVRK